MSDRHHPDARLSAFLDDELDEAEALAVTRHLADCPRCLEELEDLRQARSALRSLPPLTPPAQLFDGVAAAAARSEPPGAAKVAAVATAGMVLLLGIAFAVGEESGDVVPPVDVVVVDHVARTGGGPVIAPVDLSGR